MSSDLENKFVTKSLPDLYLKSDFADVHFAFTMDGETIKVPAHKNILAVASPVFRAMFFGPMKEKDVVNITDTNDSAFKEFLQFFYLAKVTLSMENIKAVVQLVDKYDMMECLDSCVEFLENQLTLENMIWGFQLAISMNNEKLKDFCQNRIQLLTNDYFKSDIFLQCDREVVKYILQLEALCCSEAQLFEACHAWAKTSCQLNGLDENDPENLKKQLGDCFYLIRFGAMEDKEIGAIMSNEQYKGLFTKDEVVDISCSKSVANFQSKVFENASRLSIKWEWDNDNVLTCNRKSTTNGSWYIIQSRESTCLSTNSLLLLGEISCACVFNSSGYGTSMNFTLSIIEWEEQTFVDSGSKVVFTGSVQCDNSTDGSISLTPPIIINPKKMYEIRLEKKTSADVRHNNIWSSEVKLNADVTIKFHQNPWNNSSQSGLVSALKFNQTSK